MVTTLIVSDIRFCREGLAESLGRRPGIEVIGTLNGIDEVWVQLHEARPDVVLVYVSMLDGATITRVIVSCSPTSNVVTVAIPHDAAQLIALAEAGMAGFVTAEDSIEDLAATIRRAARGEMICSPSDSRILLRHVRTLADQQKAPLGEQRLTTRELQVVSLIELGLTNYEIAQRLCIRLSTVKNHVHRILEKLQVRGRTEAARWARMNVLPTLVQPTVAGM
jgi:two-component system, NarL family, nitrate/nitrite response regulator NarL